MMKIKKCIEEDGLRDGMRKIILISTIVGTGFLLLAAAQITGVPDAGRLDVARFTTTDELIYPSDTDRWVFIGASIGGDYSDAEFDPSNPGSIGVVQMEPNAYAYLQENGEYADGTMFLLTFYETQEKSQPGLNGFVQGNATSSEIHLIDRAKFLDQHGFYLYDADAQGSSAMLPPGNACVQCHDQHGDFNSTFVQFYPTIRDLVSQDSNQAN